MKKGCLMNRVFSTVSVLVSLLFASAPARASAFAPTSLSSGYDRADAVALGVVATTGSVTTFTPSDVWKGALRPGVAITLQGRPTPDGQLILFLLSRRGGWDVIPQLLFLIEPPLPGDTSRLATTTVRPLREALTAWEAHGADRRTPRARYDLALALFLTKASALQTPAAHELSELISTDMRLSADEMRALAEIGLNAGAVGPEQDKAGVIFAFALNRGYLGLLDAAVARHARGELSPVILGTLVGVTAVQQPKAKQFPALFEAALSSRDADTVVTMFGIAAQHGIPLAKNPTAKEAFLALTPEDRERAMNPFTGAPRADEAFLAWAKTVRGQEK